MIMACGSCFSAWLLLNDCIHVLRLGVTSADSTDETVSLLRRSESVKRSNSPDRGLVDAAKSDCVVDSDAIRAEGTVKEIFHDSLMNVENSGGISNGALKQSSISHWAVVSSWTEKALGGKIQWIAWVDRIGLRLSGSSARAVAKS